MSEKSARNADQHQAERRRLPVVAAERVAERVVVDEQHHRQRRVRGSALREEVRLDEDLRGPDDLQDHRDQQDRADLRQRDVPDLLPEPGAVDRRRLVELAVDAGQRGEVDDHGAAGVRPRRLEHERGQRRMLRLDPRLRPDADPAEDGVEDAARARRRRTSSRAAPRRPAESRPAGRRARCTGRAGLRTSLISTAATSGIG